jgi:hypothetical protein
MKALIGTDHHGKFIKIWDGRGEFDNRVWLTLEDAMKEFHCEHSKQVAKGGPGRDAWEIW